MELAWSVVGVENSFAAFGGINSDVCGSNESKVWRDVKFENETSQVFSLSCKRIDNFKLQATLVQKP